MKISIITVCYNAEAVIAGAVRSTLEQSYTDIEYVIVDGGSTDKTLEILEPFRDRIACLKSEKDEGIYDAMNKGVSLATGDYVLFMNSDDMFASLDSIKNAVDQGMTAEIVYGDADFVDEATGVTTHRRFPAASKRFFCFDNLCHQSVFYRRSAFDRVGKFDTSFRVVADYEWFLRALTVHHLSFQHVDVDIAVYRLGGFSRQHMQVYDAENERVRRQYYSPIERRVNKVLLIGRHYASKARSGIRGAFRSRGGSSDPSTSEMAGKP